jgi:hypothetical protein
MATDTLSAPAPDELLTEAEAAALARLAPATLRAWRSQGLEPPFVRLGSRAIRYRRQDLLDWIAAGAVHPLPIGRPR